MFVKDFCYEIIAKNFHDEKNPKTKTFSSSSAGEIISTENTLEYLAF